MHGNILYFYTTAIEHCRYTPQHYHHNITPHHYHNNITPHHYHHTTMSSLFFNQQQQQFFSSVMKLFKVKAVVISHKLRQKKANDS